MIDSEEISYECCAIWGHKSFVISDYLKSVITAGWKNLWVQSNTRDIFVLYYIYSQVIFRSSGIVFAEIKFMIRATKCATQDYNRNQNFGWIISQSELVNTLYYWIKLKLLPSGMWHQTASLTATNFSEKLVPSINVGKE
jgi:hypothetical protein